VVVVSRGQKVTSIIRRPRKSENRSFWILNTAFEEEEIEGGTIKERNLKLPVGKREGDQLPDGPRKGLLYKSAVVWERLDLFQRWT